MRHVLGVVLLVALVANGAAFAARGDPEKRITPADRARAKSMLLRKADFNAAFSAFPIPTGGNDEFYCAALDESDLTLGGDATSPNFRSTTENVTSAAHVYASRADADASWRRATSPAGMHCLREGLRAELQGDVRLVSFERRSFPKRGRRSVAFRTVASARGLRVYLDLVAMQVSRAQASVIYVSALTPPQPGELRRLTSLVAKRAEKAMRGTS